MQTNFRCAAVREAAGPGLPGVVVEDRNQMTESRPERRSQSRPLLISAAVALVLVVAAVLWHAHEDSANSALPPGAVGPAAASAPAIGPGSGAATTSFASHGVAMVELDGFNGKLTIGLGSGPRVTVTSSGAAANAASPFFRLNAATHTLVLACADRHGVGAGAGAASAAVVACPALDYGISVPAGMGVKLDELSGQASLIGLSGPVSITATSADTTARDLHTAEFTAAITSGTLDAGFATAPTHVAVSVTSAHATLRLPGTVRYDVARQAVSADIEVGVPQADTSPYEVQAVATSGEISLLTNS